MSKPVIAVDVDDVLSQSAAGFTSFSNKMWGTDLSVETYDEHWGDMWRVDDAEVNRRNTIIWEHQIARDFKVMPDAKEVLLELLQDYTLIVVTSRPNVSKDMTEDWLAFHFPGVFDAVYFAGFYDDGTNHAARSATKGELLGSLGATFVIDDQIKHCVAAHDIGVESLLFGDYRWSRNATIPDGVTRVADWQAVKVYFDELRRS